MRKIAVALLEKIVYELIDDRKMGAGSSFLGFNFDFQKIFEF